MNSTEIIQKGREILSLAHCEDDSKPGEHFAHWAENVAYVAQNMTQTQRINLPWFDRWVREFRILYDDFEAKRTADPMMVYWPINNASMRFHKSQAFIRVFMGGNRVAKTTAGYAEDYFALTGYHPFRKVRPGQGSVFVVCGIPFRDYGPLVFEKKLLHGEDNNPLSPMFPEGGKWFHSYNKKEMVIHIACKECAEAGKALRCPGHHQKYTFSLISAEKPVSTVEAFSVKVAHGDEHLPEEFLGAMQQRVLDQQGCLIFTFKPDMGPDAWEIKKLVAEAKSPKNPDDPNVFLATCSQYEGNILTREMIDKNAATLDEFEYKVRVLGEPAAIAKNPVFDRTNLSKMINECNEPIRGVLTCPVPLNTAHVNTKMEFQENSNGLLRIWARPQDGAQYLLGVDTAAGLTHGDPSCASVLEMKKVGTDTYLEMVAQYHGWLTTLDYADEIHKLAIHYNSALVVIELTGGYGRSVLERLGPGRDGSGLCYWNVFRDIVKAERAEFGLEARFGVETTQYSKAGMVGTLQHYVKHGQIIVKCRDTLNELLAYEQDKTDGGTVRFRGAYGSHDDRVMSLVIGTSVAANYPVFDHNIVKPGKEIPPEWKEIHRELEGMRKPCLD